MAKVRRKNTKARKCNASTPPPSTPSKYAAKQIAKYGLEPAATDAAPAPGKRK